MEQKGKIIATWYAIKKGRKYLERYENLKGKWTYAPQEAAFMSREMAENFADITHGYVVKLYISEEHLQ